MSAGVNGEEPSVLPTIPIPTTIAATAAIESGCIARAVSTGEVVLRVVLCAASTERVDDNKLNNRPHQVRFGWNATLPFNNRKELIMVAAGIWTEWPGVGVRSACSGELGQRGGWSRHHSTLCMVMATSKGDDAVPATAKPMRWLLVLGMFSIQLTNVRI